MTDTVLQGFLTSLDSGAVPSIPTARTELKRDITKVKSALVSESENLEETLIPSGICPVHAKVKIAG